MLSAYRQWFNNHFTEKKYLDYTNLLKQDFPNDLDFRVAETPIFISKAFKEEMLQACESIIDKMIAPEFKVLTQNAIPDTVKVKGEEGQPQFLIFDFGVCANPDTGGLTPMLIEMQGFATLFCYQLHQYQSCQNAYGIANELSPFFNGFDEPKTIAYLKQLIVGDGEPEHTILLEIFPEKQKTRIDFKYTEKYLGIKTVCITQLIKEGRELYYQNNGKKTKIKRIYNRLIFDELHRQSTEVQEKAQILFEDLDVKWVAHPNWFYRISKYALPFLNHPNVPETHFLDKLDTIPTDLENYVLKPLFSFAGNGVIIDVQEQDLLNIKDRENYILQKKVHYAPAIKTMDENAKTEIRVFYLWKDGEARPIATNNLARLTKDKMISVALNKNKTWVGGTFALFE